MATASSLLVCTHCLADLSECDQNKPCPRCGSVVHTRRQEEQEFKNLLTEKGFSPLQPITGQTRKKMEDLENTPASHSDKHATAEMLRQDALRYLVTAPMQIKLDSIVDVLQMTGHGLLSQGEDAKKFISLGIKLGDLCRNLNEYMNLRYGKK